MSHGVSLHSFQQCPQCKSQEFKRFKTSSSVIYYMPVSYEEQIQCARCNWRLPGQNINRINHN
jgi:C4-type Zn-finger protein